MRSLNTNFLGALDSIPPGVFGTQMPYKAGLSCACSSAFLFAAKTADSTVLKAALRQHSCCSANTYPASSFGSHLKALTLPYPPLPVFVLLPEQKVAPYREGEKASGFEV